MSQPGRDYSWLPQHQLHVALTLAHVDDLVALASEVFFNYMQSGPLVLENIADGQMSHVTVAAVAPLPAAINRYAADALTQLRATIEHTVYAEVEHLLGRQLTEAEGRRIDMPGVPPVPRTVSVSGAG
jgi:hypothetical protein